jgi:Skp family chaperone for outer membrane proteins
MNNIFRIAAIFLLAVACSALVHAQVAVPVASPKVGVINSDDFTDPKTGINRLLTAQRMLEAEFKPRQDELNTLTSRLQQAARDLDTLKRGTDQKAYAAKAEQADALQRDIKYKQEDARSLYAKRYSALTEPIRQSIFAALQAFARQRSVDLLVDLAKFPDGLLLVNTAADLTPAFIRDFNSKNP